MVQFEQQKAAPQVLEPPTGPSRKTSTEIAGGDGLMTHRTHPPVDTSKVDETREPVSLGEALAEVLPKIRPLAHNMTLRIEHDDPEGPLTTLGSLRAATDGLDDDTPIWVIANERWEFFEGLQIGGER